LRSPFYYGYLPLTSSKDSREDDMRREN